MRGVKKQVVGCCRKTFLYFVTPFLYCLHDTFCIFDSFLDVLDTVNHPLSVFAKKSCEKLHIKKEKVYSILFHDARELQKYLYQNSCGLQNRGIIKVIVEHFF